MKRIVLVAIILIVFFIAALGLAIASCVIPQWVSYTGTRLGVDPNTGNLTSYWYNVRTGLFRRCITEEGKEAENCWLHGDGEEAIYDNAMRGSCETCKYLFLIGTGIGAIFGITFSAVAICVVAGVIRIMILISGLAAGALQTVAIILWVLHWFAANIPGHAYDLSFWLGLAAAVVNLIAAALSSIAVFMSFKAKKSESTEVVVGTVYTAHLRESTQTDKDKEEGTSTQLL